MAKCDKLRLHVILKNEEKKTQLYIFIKKGKIWQIWYIDNYFQYLHKIQTSILLLSVFICPMQIIRCANIYLPIQDIQWKHNWNKWNRSLYIWSENLVRTLLKKRKKPTAIPSMSLITSRMASICARGNIISAILMSWNQVCFKELQIAIYHAMSLTD